jgi:8-oxo-dGTP pyrophosphatase MutT (NUDIX family)
MQTEKSAGVIVFRQEKKERKYLLLHYEEGHWDFVKGKMEKNETEIQTLVREANEEAGLKDLELIDGFKEKISYFFKRNEELVSKEVIFYLAKTHLAKIMLSNEHIGYKWVSFENALRQLTYKNAQELLKTAESFLRGRD